MRASSSRAKRIIQVFIASAGDVAEERREFKQTIDELNEGFGRGADVEFVPLGWEDALSQVGRRSQNVINQEVDACDIFVLVMWRRWGQEAPDAAPYTSYTEEEFYRALHRFEKERRPEIFVFFKHIDPGQMADPGPQLSKVLAFRKKLESTRQVLYRSFKTVKDFGEEINTHLVAYAKGDIVRTPNDVRIPLLPDSIAAEVEKHKEEAQRAVEEMAKLKAEMQQAMEAAEKARAEAKDALARAEAAEGVVEAKAARKAVELAEKAAKAALEGNIEEARQDFARALDGTTNLQVLRLGFQFFMRVGEFEEAERLARRQLAISGPDATSTATAKAYSNLAWCYRQREDYENAEAILKKALAIEEQLGALNSLASDYANLSSIYSLRGDTAQAEAILKKALSIKKTISGQRKSPGLYGARGLLYARKGNLGKAEEVMHRALAEAQSAQDAEGAARAFCNLGRVVTLRGRPEEAREYLAQAMTLFRQLGMSKEREVTATLLADLDETEGSTPSPSTGRTASPKQTRTSPQQAKRKAPKPRVRRS